MAIVFNSTYIKDSCYPTVEKALSNKSNQNKFRNDLDKYLSENILKLNVNGPLKSVVFNKVNIDNVFKCLELDPKTVTMAVREMKKHATKGKGEGGTDETCNIFATPVYIAIALATRFFLLKRDAKGISSKEKKDYEDQITRCIYYTSVPIYALLQKKYYSTCEPNPSVMEYAISNMIEKSRIKQTGSMLDTIFITTKGALEFYEDRLKEGNDESITQYISAVRTRLNSIMRKITNAYMEAFENRDAIIAEKESMSDKDFYQSDSNSQFIERNTNKIIQTLMTDGPDMKLVEIAAKNNSASMADLRLYMITLCRSHAEELKTITEALMILYFSENQDITIRDIGTDKFLLFGMDIYARANTNNEHIIRIKNILDKWVDDLKISKRTGTQSTTSNYRRAIYMIIVMEIIKISK